MNKIKKSYFVILLISIFLVSTMYFSYAFFTSKNEEHGKLNIVAGTLDYKIESEQLENNKVTVGFNETKVIDIKLTSLNTIDSKYEVYYNYITSLTETEINNISIGYTTTNKDSISGEIEANKSKNLRIYINNGNDKDIEIEFNVIGGLTSDELVISDGVQLVNNDIIVPDFDVVTEVTDGVAYVSIDTYDSLSGVASVEYNGQVQTLPKNRDDYKIYVHHNTLVSSETIEKALHKYNNKIIVTSLNTIDEIKADNYNLVMQNNLYGQVTSGTLNTLFTNGINIYSHGNDTDTSLSFIQNSIRIAEQASALTDIVTTTDNIITRNYNGNFSSGDNGQNFVKFREGAKVWYQGTYEDNIYDIMGYYYENNTRWIHNQSNISFPVSYYGMIADYLLKINTADFEMTESGDYTFKVTDYVGNVSEKTVHIDIE